MAVIAHIEDNIADHALLKRVLNTTHTLHHFNDLEDFFLSNYCYNLIITDLRLPKNYGFEAIEKIHNARPDTPLLALTGMAGVYMTGDIIAALIKSGARNVVSKDLLCDGTIKALIEELLI